MPSCTQYTTVYPDNTNFHSHSRAHLSTPVDYKTSYNSQRAYLDALTEHYRNLVIAIVRFAVLDLRKGDQSAASFLLSEYCERLLELSGIDRAYWKKVRARIFAEAGFIEAVNYEN